VLELVEHLVAGDELDAVRATSGHDDRRAVVADWRRRLVDRRLTARTTTTPISRLAITDRTDRLESTTSSSPKTTRE
jgi:hypothetical protein